MGGLAAIVEALGPVGPLNLVYTGKLMSSITLAMCPEKMLHTKPIDLRHICLFYLGHMYVLRPNLEHS